VTGLLEDSVPIVKADMVAKLVEQQEELKVTAEQVKSIMKDDLGLGYRIARKVPAQGNTERCLVLRQQYAQEMIPLLQMGTRILNIDESWLNETNFTRLMWCPPSTPRTIS
jgi:hypothetical protein